MNTQKAAYWLALALFGLALHSEYQRGAFPRLQQTVNRASSEACHLTAQARQAVFMARLLAGDRKLRPEDLVAQANARELVEAQAEVSQALEEQARDRAELIRDQVRAQVRMIRGQLEVERVERQQIRLCPRSRIRVNDSNQPIFVVCPKTGAAIAVADAADLSDLDTELSEIEIGDWF